MYVDAFLYFFVFVFLLSSEGYCISFLASLLVAFLALDNVQPAQCTYVNNLIGANSA